MKYKCAITFPEITTSSCTDALVKICESMVAFHPDRFDQDILSLNFISENDEPRTPSADMRKVSDKSIYVDVHGGANILIERMEAVVLRFGYTLIHGKISNEEYKCFVVKAFPRKHELS